MKTFEIFSEPKKGQNGRRGFKALLHEVYPDDCVDKDNGVGTVYNLNGITWIREYCEKALPTIKGMSLRCEFLNDERTELCGHGKTDVIDGVPIFEDATVIGTFTDGYIDEVELPDGKKITACIGVGEIDSSCYHNLCEKLDEDIANGYYPSGSVEIMRTAENKGIVYEYGYKEEGRIPAEFIYSGYALLGVLPGDRTAQLVELNERKEEKGMNEQEIAAIVEKAVSAYTSQVNEINEVRKQCDATVAELNQQLETVTNEKNELVADSDSIKAALEKLREEHAELNKKYEELWEERRVLEEALAEAQARELIAKLDGELKNFSDEDIAYAQSEVNAFKEKPIESEINSVLNKIYEGIGRKAVKEQHDNVDEQNQAKHSAEDIFGVVELEHKVQEEDTGIF